MNTAAALLLDCYNQQLVALECALRGAQAEQETLPMWAVDQLSMTALSLYQSIVHLRHYARGLDCGEASARLLFTLELADQLADGLLQRTGECSCGTKALSLATAHVQQWLPAN